MNIAVENIKVMERIRKLTSGVDELAKDIQKNGLINPITVMAVEGESRYQLLAGLRRLRAAQFLGWEQIEVTVVPPKDAEAALNIEYSENVQREAFTFSEKMDYARLIAEIEKAKAKERMSLGGQGKDLGPDLKHGQRRDIIGSKIGMSGHQYDRAAFIANHAPQEMIDELDRGERSIRGTYDVLRANEKAYLDDTIESKAVPANKKPKTGSVSELPNILPMSDLDRAIRAEQELDAMKYRQHNEIFHRDSIIANLKIRVAELEAALEAANIRIHELEGFHAAAL